MSRDDTSIFVNEDNVLVRRLRNFAQFSKEEEAVLKEFSNQQIRRVGARNDLVREGDPPRFVLLIFSGWAARYKMLEDGRRQMLEFLLPGDMCDLNNFVLREMDHSIATITSLTYVELSHHSLRRIEGYPRIKQAMWWHMLTSIAMQREWAVSLGQRTAYERMGHLFCEVYHRLRAVGLTEGTSCEMPLTQMELAETTGITAVHVNRTLQELRRDGLITLKDKVLDIPDLAALEWAVLFWPAYLHLSPEGVQLGSHHPVITVET